MRITKWRCSRLEASAASQSGVAAALCHRTPKEGRATIAAFRRVWASLLFLALFFEGCMACPAENLVLFTNAPVRGEGVFLSDIVYSTNATLPHLRLCDAPALGQIAALSRAQVLEAATKAGADLGSAVWSGGDRVRIMRRVRPLNEAELRDQLRAVLQREVVRDKGQLEIRFLRPWTASTIPDEDYTLKILDLPSSGVTPNFIVRIELRTARDTLGPCQIPLAARVWDEVWVARTPLEREQLFSDADITKEKRDVLSLRETPFVPTEAVGAYEIAEHIPAGAPVYAHSVRLRPVVFRGRMVDAQVQTGAMSISLKVEVLENGVPGQLVRVRNPQSRREFRGKVQNEQSILVNL
jgi:flagella basal body P-ring formation protein FlgA